MARAPRPRPSGPASAGPQEAGPPEAQRVCVAQFGAAHGIRGEVRLKAFTADPMALADYAPLESEDGTRHFAIASLRPAKDMLIARIEGVADRTAAEALCNLRLYVPRERLGAAAPDEFYYADLIGLAARSTQGDTLGTVVAVHNFGAGDLLEVAPPGLPSVFVPFTQAVVPEVDVAGGFLRIDPPAGLFEDGADDEGPPS